MIGFGHIRDNQTTLSKHKALSAVTDKLQNRHFDFWHKLLFKDNRVINNTVNKLRTYRKIKTDFKRKHIFMETQTLIRKVEGEALKCKIGPTLN